MCLFVHFTAVIDAIRFQNCTVLDLWKAFIVYIFMFCSVRGIGFSDERH